MLKKMRWRFIGAAMAAIIAVVLVLLCMINLWSYTLTTDQQDRTLSMLLESEFPEMPPIDRGADQEAGTPPAPFDGHSPELQYMLRFFSVEVDTQGNVQSVDMEHIASISSEDATAYATAVLQSGSMSGYYGEYRYLKKDSSSGSTIIFLNSEREIQAMQRLLLVSGGVTLVSLSIVFLLVILFSKRAIAPYIRNIEAQKQFVTDASHELKTPLTAIATSADILAMETENNEWVANIQQQCSRLAKLVANLITLSRLNEVKPFPEKTTFSLSDAVWEISEPIHAIAEAHGKVYTQNIENNLFLCGDKNGIQQMVSILLDNAVKYSDANGRIQLSVQKKQRKIVITVSNTCTQQDKMDLNRLFDRFYRPDRSRAVNSGGMGIGLSIAKATAEAHGGKISAKYSEQNTICFTVIL